MTFNVEDIIFTIVFLVGIIALGIFIVNIVNISKNNRKNRMNTINSKIDDLSRRVDMLESK